VISVGLNADYQISPLIVEPDLAAGQALNIVPSSGRALLYVVVAVDPRIIVIGKSGLLPADAAVNTDIEAGPIARDWSGRDIFFHCHRARKKRCRSQCECDN